MEKVSKIMPYEVPKNYFDQLPQQLTVAAKSAHGLLEEPIIKYSKEMPFHLEQDYFNSFSKNVMKSVNQHQKAVDDLESKIGRRNVFDVPKGYFEGFATQVITEINESEFDLVELGELEALQHVNTYQAPENYFENFSESLKPHLQHNVKKQKKREPVYHQLRTYGINQWVVAASMLLIFTLGGIWMYNGQGEYDATAITKNQLAQVPKVELSKYIENNIDEFDLSLIEKEVSKHPMPTRDKTESMLQEVSEEDIQEYLEELGI